MKKTLALLLLMVGVCSAQVRQREIYPVDDRKYFLFEHGFDANDFDPNGSTIRLPTFTEGSIIFADPNGDLFEDNNNLYFDDVNDWVGIALGSIADQIRPNNYLQVYQLLNFDPDVFNTSIGWSFADTLTGPNNVRIGYYAGRDMDDAAQNTLGGRGSGQAITDSNDNAFWGFQTGRYVEGLPVRDEAHAIANNGYVQFFDEDYTTIRQVVVSGGSAMSIDIDDNGVIVSGSSTPRIYRWDPDMNLSTDFYTPALGYWGLGTGTRYFASLKFSSDSSYLYAVLVNSSVTPYVFTYKFSNTTGAEIWRVYHRWETYGAYVDSSDRIWICMHGSFAQPWGAGYGNGVVCYDSDGVRITDGPPDGIYELGSRKRDCHFDPGTNRIFACGYAHRVSSMLYDGTGVWGATFEENAATVAWCVQMINNRLYCCGDRQNMGAYYATVFELNPSTGAILDYYDTGSATSSYLWEDADGNIIVKGVNSDKIYVLDADLTWISEHAWTDFGDLYGPEGVAVPHAAGGVPLGSRNTAIGSQALAGASSGAEPNEASAGGFQSMFNVSAGDLSTAWGAYSLHSLITGSRDVALGPYAGYNLTTEDDILVIDNRDRGSAANELTGSILYGIMDATAASQTLNINAVLTLPYGGVFLTEQADAIADVAGDGQIWVNTATPNELWFTNDVGDDIQLTSGSGNAIRFYTWHYDLGADIMPAYDIRGDETDYWEVNSSDYSELMPIAGSGVSAGWELDGNDDLMPQG